MATLEHLDALLGESCELLSEAVGEIRGLNEVNRKSLIGKLGRNIAEIWNIREEIYSINPEIKRDFVIENKQDPIRFESLRGIFIKALEEEKSGALDTAYTLYSRLHENSRFGYFKILSEAGMFRTGRKGI